MVLELPNDMNAVLKAKLRHDALVYGTCFYEETQHGYERMGPVKAIKRNGDE